MNLQITLFTDCPTPPTVTPSSGPFKAGDVLTCMSNGYTEPTYTWIDSKGVVVFTGPNITLTNSSFVLNCTATVSLTNSCSRSVVVRNSEGMLYSSLFVLANMNSRLRSLYAIAVPSVCLSVCRLSSVCNVGAPNSAG